MACGVTDHALALRLAKNLFLNKFARAFDTKEHDIKAAFKTLERQPDATRIDLEPFIKNYIYAYHYWIKTKFWCNTDPADFKFPVDIADEILRDADIHNQFILDGDSNKTSAKPPPFSKDSNWDDWSDTFNSYLKLIPGISGLPLNYIIPSHRWTRSLFHWQFNV